VKISRGKSPGKCRGEKTGRAKGGQMPWREDGAGKRGANGGKSCGGGG